MEIWEFSKFFSLFSHYDEFLMNSGIINMGKYKIIQIKYKL